MAGGDLKTQIEISADATGVETGVTQAKRSLNDLGKAASDAGAQGKSGLSGIGAGGDEAAKKVDAATKSLINSIQRTTAAMEAGSKGSADYFRVLANQRGVSADVLNPYLAQLEAASALQKNATAGVSGTAHAMEGLSFQTAAAKRELLVLTHELSQGNFSRFGSSLLVLGERTGAASLLFSSAGVAAAAFVAAIGAVAVAVIQGSHQISEFNKEIILSGNAAGGTVGSYRAMAESLAKLGGSQGAALNTIAAFVETGRVGAENLERFAAIAQQLDRLVGKPVADTAKEFASLAEKPLEGSIKLNQQYNYLTASIYSQIRALTEQGRVQDAARLAQEAYANATSVRVAEIAGSLGTLSRSWLTITDYAHKAWDAMAGVGRPLSLQQQLAAVSAEIEKARAPFNASVFGGNAEARAHLPVNLERQANLQEQIRQQQRLGEIAAKNSEQTRARAEWEDVVNQNLTKQEKLKREIQVIEAKGLANGSSRAEIEKEIANARQRLTDTTGQNEVAEIVARTKGQKEYLALLQEQIKDQDKLNDPAKLTQGEKDVKRIQEELKTSITGVARAQKEKALAAALDEAATDRSVIATERQKKGLQESIAAHVQAIDAARKDADQVKQLALGQEAANATFGKSKTAIEQMTLAQMQANFAELDAFDSADPKYIASLQEKINWQQRYVKALQDTEFKQESLKLQEEARANSEDVKTLQLEISLLGQTQQARDIALAQRKAEVDLAKELARIDKDNLGTGPDADAKRAELKATATANAAQAASTAAAKVVADQWQRTADSINQSLTDAFVQAFDHTKSLAQSLRDALKSMFDNLVLRPTINAALSPVSGVISSGVNSILGTGNSGIGSSLVSAGGSLFNGGSLSNAGGVIGAFGQGFSGSAAIGTGSSFASTVGGGLATDAMGAGVAEGAAAAGIETGIGAGVEAGLAAVPVVGWIALAGLALYSIFGGKGGGPKTEGGFAPNGMDISGIDIGGSVQGSQRGDVSSAKQLSEAISTGLTGLGQEFGVTLSKDIGVFFAKDPQGDSLTQLQIVSANFNRSKVAGGIENVGRSDAEFKAAVDLATAQLDLSELAHALTGKIGDYLKAIDPTDLSTAQITAAIQQAATAKQLTDAFNVLGPSFKSVADLSVESLNSVATAMGGAQKATTTLSDYFNNFYSDTEKRAAVVDSITRTLNGAGLAVTTDQVGSATRNQFRALLDQEVAMGDAGAAAAEALLSVNSAFASITQSTTNITADTLRQRLGNSGLADLVAPGQSQQIQAGNIQQRLAQSGLNFTVEQITGATTQQFAELYQQMVRINNLDAANALLDVADAFVTMKKPAEDYANTLRVNMGNALMAIKNQQASLTQQLLELTNPQAAVAASRQKELAAMNSSLWTLQKRVWAEQDLRTAQDKLSAAAQSWVDVLQPVIDKFNAQANALRDFRVQLTTSDLGALDPKAQLATTKADLSKATPDNVQELVSRFLAAAQDQAKTRLDLLRSVGFSAAQVKTQEDYARTQANLAQEQLNAIQALVNPLRTINESVLSLEDAILAVIQAKADIAANPVPGFASGGFDPGGVALVGENGPELIRSGPVNVINSAQTAKLLAGGADAQAEEIRQMRAEMRMGFATLAGHNKVAAKALEKWDHDGIPETRTL
jgi:phage-related minor tail protein